MVVRACDLETVGGGSFGVLEKVWCCTYAYRDPDTNNLKSGILYFGDTPLDEIRDSSQGQLLQQWIYEDLTIWHNATFDVPILRSLGFDVPWYHDTMLMGYCVNPNINPVCIKGHKPEKYSLWAWGIRLGKHKMEAPPFDTWTKELEVYAINDSEVTLHVYEYLERILKRDHQAWQHYVSIEQPYQTIIIEMQEMGLHIDIENLDKLVLLLEGKMSDIIAEMQEIVPIAPGGKKWYKKPHDELLGDEKGQYFYLGERDKNGRIEYGYQQWADFKPTPDATTWALQHHYGWEPTERTKTGKPKTSKDVLNELDFPLAVLKTEYNQVSTLLSSFGYAFLNKRDDNDFIHANWNQTVARTGRLSSSNPNLQNIPANSDLGQEFRKVVTAIPGYDLVGIDLQAIEYRVLASLMFQYFVEEYGDVPPDVQFMVDVFRHDPDTEEGDIHTQMANLWLSHLEDRKKARKIGKNISYGRMFGFGKVKASKMMGVSVEEATSLINRANETNPSFTEFKEAVWDEFRNNGGIGHTLFGRRLVYPEICLEGRRVKQTLFKGRIVVPAADVGWRKARAERQAFNAKIQGTAADIIKVLALESIVPAWEFGARLLAAVHDELLFLCPEETSDQLVLLLNRVFDKPHMIPAVPVMGTAQKGKTWYDVH